MSEDRQNLNMREISIATAINLVRESILCDCYDPFMFIGVPGIGKTEGFSSLAKELGIGCKEIRLVNHTETDILGLPHIEKLADGKAVSAYATTKLLPIASIDGERGILLLDELPSAERSVRATALQLLDSSRGVGEYKLPEKWIVVALGNGPDDGGVFNGLESAVLNRMQGCYRVSSTFESWKPWALDHGIESSIMAFISQDPTSYLHKMPSLTSDNVVEVFPSPRSWTKLSTILTTRGKLRGRALEPDEIGLYASGCIGEQMSNTFEAFYRHTADLIPMSVIFSGAAPTTFEKLNSELSCLLSHTLVKSLRDMLDNKNRINATDKSLMATMSDYSVETQTALKNTIAWVCSLTKTKADVATMIIQQMTSDIENLMSIMLDEDCSGAEYEEFLARMTKIMSV